MVGSQVFDQLREYSECAAAAQGTHEDEGQQVRWETNSEHGRLERLAEQIDPARGAEHADGHKNRDQVRDDANSHIETFLGALDEFLVNLDSPQRRVKRETGEQQRN